VFLQLFKEEKYQKIKQEAIARAKEILAKIESQQ